MPHRDSSAQSNAGGAGAQLEQQELQMASGLSPECLGSVWRHPETLTYGTVFSQTSGCSRGTRCELLLVKRERMVHITEVSPGGWTSGMAVSRSMFFLCFVSLSLYHLPAYGFFFFFIKG